MPASKESSTSEWQSAQVMPTELRRRPLSSKNPRTPTTALSLSSASVVAGLVRSTRPCFSIVRSCGGSASTSTFRPSASAASGLSPSPTPPFARPGDGLVQTQGLAPEGFVAEGVVPEDAPPVDERAFRGQFEARVDALAGDCSGAIILRDRGADACDRRDQCR